MKTAFEITEEKDPYLREIWAMGYDEVIEDHPMHEMLLIRKSDKYIKRIPMFSLAERPFTIKTSRLIDWSIHSWIAEADGSCERFRTLIKP